jgi:protein-S-isoprenylcysteine O-methyltransferase Ste14
MLTRSPAMRVLESRIPPVALVLLLGLLMWVLAHVAPAFGFMLPAGRLIAAGLVATGTAVAGLGVATFRRAGTTVNPLQPDAATALVESGVYQLTRNPMYLGMLLGLLGWAFWLGHAPAFALAALFVPLMNRLQIIPEERALAARFGRAFADYRIRVRRWL